MVLDDNRRIQIIDELEKRSEDEFEVLSIPMDDKPMKEDKEPLKNVNPYYFKGEKGYVKYLLNRKDIALVFNPRNSHHFRIVIGTNSKQ